MKPEKKKKTMRRSLILGSLIALLIAISPYVFYLYESFPKAEVWETPFFSFKSAYFSTVYMAAWNFVNKFVPLYLLLLWFFTCRHWWYHIILIPIAMYAFQLFGTINDNVSYVDEMEIYYLIPIMLVIIPIVYLLRLRLFDKIVHGIDMKKLDEELKKYEVEDDDFSK
ncbi:hypothetical protein IBL28_14950 [Sinomicrobium sp. FJxs]|uniref:Uncharacterized protein n=2 Tax=Sinomicrobium weinanense TaxID=2842200 RepID=A0A926JU75_9FLAO|nr:hypothetical protein [Sinomicrobium weinanense]MBU3122327.1 hypothetical protein [Sinomicrobium weinanense]